MTIQKFLNVYEKNEVFIWYIIDTNLYIIRNEEILFVVIGNICNI